NTARVGVRAGHRESIGQPPRKARLQRVVIDFSEWFHDAHGRRCPEAVSEPGLVEWQARVTAADLAVIDVLAAHDVALAVADVADLCGEVAWQHLLHRRVERRDDAAGVLSGLVRGDRRTRGYVYDRLRQVEDGQ